MIILISKRKLKLFVAGILAVFLIFVGFNFIFGSQNNKENYKELVEALRQQDIQVSDEVLTATSRAADSSGEIQIFDVGKGRIVKKMQTGPVAQAEAEKILNSITGVYVKVRPFPEKGYIVRLPLDPALRVKNSFINATVDKVYIIFTEKDPPILLILDSQEKPFIYNFNRSTDALKKFLNFNFTYE